MDSRGMGKERDGALAILGVALLAALRPVMHAVRIEPASMLRGE
jgi:ABC-type lipoprotein release transport system permease subunit